MGRGEISMIKKEEVILLYNFKDKTELEKLKALLEKLKIKFIVADEKAYQQKVGYLFGLKGFNENEDDGSIFDFKYELMMFHNFSRARLDTVLKKMREEEIKVPICKAIVTSFNRFWKLRRVCETMEKEHLSMSKEKN